MRWLCASQVPDCKGTVIIETSPDGWRMAFGTLEPTNGWSGEVTGRTLAECLRKAQTME